MRQGKKCYQYNSIKWGVNHKLCLHDVESVSKVKLYSILVQVSNFSQSLAVA